MRGFDLRAVGTLLWIPFLCADLGALIGGWTSSGLIRTGWSIDRSRKTVLFAAASLGLLGALTPLTASAGLAIAIVGAVLFGQLAWTSNVHTSITEIAPKEHVAVLYGITGAAGNGLGALVQPLIGWVVDSYGYNPAFLCAGLTYLAAMAFVAAMGKIEPISVRKA
jgi:ACS family hexuronate transporter-like MFS transporter